ncbi:MAG: fibronectin type III domain-containing protein [Planctomycetota bacterium]|jgi:hypothetical protein
MYSNEENDAHPVVLDDGTMGYEIKQDWVSSVNEFTDLAHDHNYKVITYLYVPSLWKYPSEETQEISVTLAWMRKFQEQYGFDGWYLDGGDAGGFLDDYNFIRQVRTDIGDEGIIYHHDSADVWDDRWKPPANYEYTGLRATFVDAYVDYTLSGETGTIAEVNGPTESYFRFHTSGYGLSQAYGSQFTKSDKRAAVSQEEFARALGEDLNGFHRLSGYFHWQPSWKSHFKPAYDVRKGEYLNDANVPFVPDVNWPIDGSTGWFRDPTNIVVDVNGTTVDVDWTTPDVNSDSEVAYTKVSSGVWWPPEDKVYDANMVTDHSITLSGLTANTDYEYRIRSNNGDPNIPGEIIWGYVGSFKTGN